MNCDLPLTKATVALGMTDGQFPGLVRELVFPPGKSAAEIKEMFVNDLAAAKIDTVAEQVSIGLPHPKDKKFRYTMKFVGQVRHDADDQLKKLLLDPPLSRSILIPMPTYGIIQDRNGGPNRAKINVLPFECAILTPVEWEELDFDFDSSIAKRDCSNVVSRLQSRAIKRPPICN